MNGAYTAANAMQAGAETDLLSLYAGAIGSAQSPGIFADPGGSLAATLLLLDGSAVGAFRTSGSASTQVLAIKAYNTAKGL